MKLIVITAENFLKGEAEALNLLFESGLEVLHLRKPRASQNEMKAFIEQIKIEFYSRIVLHDYYNLAELFHLKGIHLNHRNEDTFFRLFDVDGVVDKRGLSVSRSCHSLEEIPESRFYDYLFLSPIFDSISKVGYKQAFTSEQLTRAMAEKIISEKVIALGGITVENIPTVRDYGFGGIVVLGALWNGFERNSETNELLKLFNELKIKCEDQ